MNYYLITFGCQMNKSDSQRIVQLLENKNWHQASNFQEADLIIVNMCSVRQSAVDRVYGLLPKFKKIRAQNSEFKTVLTGCILKKDKEKLSQFFDYLIENQNLSQWQNLISSLFLPSKKRGKNSYFFEKSPQKRAFSSFPIGYLPISRGCNNFCSYCVVPLTRGREIYRPIEEIILGVKNLTKKGYKEIWLLGQNVNSYKFKIEKGNQTLNINFPKLLKMVDEIPGNFWIRFTSPHPKDFSEELIEAMAECKKVTPYLNLPVQSGDNTILRKMNRNYTIEKYKNLVKKIREKIPEITLSTDIIVGFPGETKKQFENTKKLMEEIKFDMAYIAQYSPREGTLASKMKDNVPKSEKKRREKILTEILRKTAFQKNKKYIGKTVKVLPLEWKNGFLIGRSFHGKKVKFEGKKSLIGKFQEIKITQALAWGLKGKLN